MSSVSEYIELARPSGALTVPFEPTPNAHQLRAVAILPVAAHQEDIERILKVYEKQSVLDNWQPYLYLNAPVEAADDPRVAENLKHLEALRSSSQPNNIRWGLRLYEWGGTDGGFGMGKVRRDAWLHVLDNLAYSGVSEDIFGFSHDADMVALSPDYIQQGISAAKNHSINILTSSVYWGLANQDVAGTSLPALNRLAAYMGMSEEAFRCATRIHSAWDSAVGFRLGFYALAGGYQEATTYNEAGSLVEALRAQDNKDQAFGRIEGQFVVSSMRRYVTRAGANESPFSAINPEVEAQDSVRDASLPFALAERHTRANLQDWCNQADDNSIRIIQERFSQTDGENVDVRIDFYEELVNHGRQLLKAAGPLLNGSPESTLPVAIEIARQVSARAQEIIAQT